MMCGCERHHDKQAECTCICPEHGNFERAYDLAMMRYDEIRALRDRLAAHEARVAMLAAKFTRYAEEVAALPPVGATGRLDAMDQLEAAVWARAAGMLLAALDEASA